MKRLILPMLLVAAGCANFENSTKPGGWPRLARISTTADLTGHYENKSSGSAGPRLEKLWFCLTRESLTYVEGATVRLTAIDERHVKASLIGKDGVVLLTYDLASPADFRIRNGVMRLPPVFADSGVGGGTCKLYKAVDGSLIGEMYGTAFGVGLFVQTAKLGDLWALWKTVP